MQKISKLLLCCLWIVAAKPITSAQDACFYNVTKEQALYLDQTREARQNYDPNNHTADNPTGIKWVPIQFHECIPSATAPRYITYTHVLDDNLKSLNTLFAQYNIQFYECGPLNTFISNTLNSYDVTEAPLLAAYDVPNVINVYYFNAVTSGSTMYCGYSFLPPSVDRVIISRACLETELFLHVMGRYFSLYNTHGKTNAVRTDELVNGSNCATAGDDVCDTPADPLQFFNSSFLNNCVYTGNMVDANGDAYQPDPSNYMSYAPFACRNKFSAQQMSRMAYSVNFDRANLTGCPHPNDCSNVVNSLPKTYDFETGMENWSSSWVEPFWIIPMGIGSGATPTPNTGPDAAWSGNNYVYADGTKNVNAGIALLRSPCLDFRGYAAPKMSFRYHAYGVDIGDIYAQVSTDGGVTWSPTPPYFIFYEPQGNQGNQWNYVVCDLTPYNNVQSFQVRIGSTIYTTGIQCDFALDDIRFYNDVVTPCALTGVVNVNNVSCSGSTNGAASVVPSGASGAVTYAWSTGATTALIQNLAPGTYTATITDALGCTTVASNTVQQPLPLQLSLSYVHVAIPGQSTGSVTANLTGGTVPYTYYWSNGATTASISNLPIGTYTVIAYDARNCYATGSARIVDPNFTCSTFYSTFPYTNSFETNIGIFENAPANTNWIRTSNPTPNANTGPSAAYHANRYLFINASTIPGRTAIIRTKDCLNLSLVPNPVVEFYYHMFGAQMGTLFVEVSTDNGANWLTIWSLSGNQGDLWQKASISLQPYNTGATRLRFRGVTGGQQSDMALDALYIGAASNSIFALKPTIGNSEIIRQDRLYPNPSEGLFTLESSGKQPFESVDIYSQTGAMVWNSSIVSSSYLIDLSTQPVGVYFVRARSGKEVVVKKIFIMRE